MEPAAVCGVRWVHVFEEDTSTAHIYRPESLDIPLSRRPRRRFELRLDGSASLYTGGPDDRFVGRAGGWREERGALVVSFPATAGEPEVHFHVTEASQRRLVVTV